MNKFLKLVSQFLVPFFIFGRNHDKIRIEGAKMIEKGLVEGMNKIYFLLKLSLYFWIIALMGGFVLGVGPALIAAIEIISEADWDFKEISFKKMTLLFKENFKRGNQIFYTFGLICLFLFLSLYTSSQMTGMLFLVIDFLLVLLLIIVAISGLFSYSVVSTYEISFKNLVKLSLILFFKEVKGSVSIVIFVLILSIVAVKFPAIAFFMGSGLLAYFLYRLGEKINQNLRIN